MSKSLRIALLLFCAVMAPVLGYAQPMPERLDMGWLLSQPKYRNIHHDSFCRDDNDSEIGNNARPDRPNVLAYKTMSVGDVRVGIKDNFATNFQNTSRDGRCIKYVELGRNDFHVTAVRADNKDTDVKVAFFIKDINHFYYVKLDKKRYEIYRCLDGKHKRIAKGRDGGSRLELFVEGKDAIIIVNKETIITVHLKEWECKQQLCGLFFENTSVSSVDDFVVDYRDSFKDAGIDAVVERDEVEKPKFGTYCASEGVCTASSAFTKNGKKSYRFELRKPTQAQVNANRDNALHSTVMLDGIKEKGGNDFAGRPGGNKPLDSYVFSVDVLFPATGSERWELDELFQELFIQEHHVGYNIPFSPSLSININKGRLFLNTIWNEAIAKGASVYDNDLHYKGEYIGRINSDEEEDYLASRGFDNLKRLPYLEKGKWHNITLYVKLGYNENQQPRTVVYIDNKLVVDWTTPNAYNCQEYGEYLEFGIYKWNWDTQENRDKTPVKRRILYFDNIKYYI